MTFNFSQHNLACTSTDQRKREGHAKDKLFSNAQNVEIVCV